MRILLLTILSFPSFLFAQISFYKTYGGAGNEFGNGIVVTSDSGYAVIGSTESFGMGSTDIYLLKLDSLGNIQWSKTFGGYNVDRGTDIQQTLDSGFIITGYSNSSNFDYNISLIKTAKNGTTEWNKEYGGDSWDFGYAVTIAKDSNYIIAGETSSYGTIESSAFALKINTIGDTLWSRYFGDQGQNQFNDVITTATNDLLFSGKKTTTNGDTDFWVVKTDSAGNILWEYTNGYGYDDGARQAFLGNDGNYFIAGTRRDSTNANDIIIDKLAPDGNYLLQSIFNNPQDDEGCFILQYHDQATWYAGGITNSYGLGGYDMYFAEIDNGGYIANGHLSTLGGSKDEYIESADTTYDHGFVMVGTTQNTANGLTSIVVVKVDSNFYFPSTFSEDIDPLKVSENDLKEIKYYPNPANDILHVNASGNYTILNVLGKHVSSGKLQNQQINIGQLTTGNYWLRLSNGKVLPFSKI